MRPTHHQLTPPASTSTIGQALPQGGHPHRQLPPAHARPRRRHLRCVCDQWHRAMVVDRLTYVCVCNLTQTNRDGRPKGPPTEEGTYLMTRAHKRGVVAHPTLHNRHTNPRNHTSTHSVSPHHTHTIATESTAGAGPHRHPAARPAHRGVPPGQSAGSN